MITDEMLEQAAEEFANAIDMSLPDPSECTHQFSHRFERKMQRLIRRVEHPALYRTLRSAACIVLVMMIGFGSILTVSVEARAAVFSWVKQQYDNFYVYFFDGKANVAEYVKYSPGWMPEGCVFVTSYETAGGEVYIYTDADDTLIQFSYTSDPSKGNLYVDGVDYHVEQIEVNNCKGEVYLSDDASKTNGIIWNDETNTVLFSVSGNFKKETLIKIAEAIEKNN